jgi:hypothetical protein
MRGLLKPSCTGVQVSTSSTSTLAGITALDDMARDLWRLHKQTSWWIDYRTDEFPRGSGWWRRTLSLTGCGVLCVCVCVCV